MSASDGRKALAQKLKGYLPRYEEPEGETVVPNKELMQAVKYLEGSE